MPDIRRAESPLADKQNSIYSNGNFLVPPGFGIDTASPGGGLYIGQNNATSVNFPIGASFPSSFGVVSMGTGDDATGSFANGVAWEMTSQQGTVAAPITVGSGPNIKISRTESIAASTMPAGNGANNWGNAGLWANAIGDVNNQAQVSALLGTSQQNSTQTRTAGQVNIDATGVQGFGFIGVGGTGNGIGGYFEGRSSSAVAGSGANGLEARVTNNTGINGVYNAGGFSGTVGIWVSLNSSTAGLTGGCMLSTDTLNGTQWDVGIGFTTVAGTSSVKTTTISDDTSSVTSIKINGTHTNSIVIANTGGPALFGGVTGLSGSADTRLELQAKTSGGTDPVLFIGSTAAAANHTMWIRNSSGVPKIGVVGSTNSLLTGSAAGDLVIFNSTSSKRVLVGGTTAIFSVANANTLAFFGKVGTEVAQQSAAGTATGYVAGATGATFHSDDTYTGNTGATGYTVNGIVAALKNYGLLAA